ncbi:hypothetical protein BEST7613_5702 [Synechocystis sp. PCC 6803]|nr:hypothetical protein BEST7613_5702 [Synechocystis sp. PCC 6803] [Bacillus subtilis BEST7613]
MQLGVVKVRETSLEFPWHYLVSIKHTFAFGQPRKTVNTFTMGTVLVRRRDDMTDNPEKDAFLYPKSKYYGDFKPEKLVFNANLQEFAQKVSVICNLETAGKIETMEAYERIKQLWKSLKESKKELGIGGDPFKPTDPPSS